MMNVNNRVEATLDLSGCKSLGEIHQRIKETLQFPDHYGCNWSAFWDSLRFDSPVEYIYVVGTETLPQQLGVRLGKMYEILDRCRQERAGLGWSFGYEIVD